MAACDPMRALTIPYFPSKQISPSIIEELSFIRWFAVALLARTIAIFAIDGSSLAGASDHALASVILGAVDLVFVIAAMIITISALIHSYKSSKFGWFALVLILGPFTAVIYAFVLGGASKYVDIPPG